MPWSASSSAARASTSTTRGPISRPSGPGSEMSDFQHFKIWLSHAVGLPKDALHVYVGLAIFLLAAILFRRSLGARLPILAVIGAALAGEIWDVVETNAAGQRIIWAASWHDLWNTCFWPLVL